MNTLFSPVFKNFWNNLQGNALSLKELDQKLIAELPCVASVLHCGKIATYVENAKELSHNSYVLYVSRNGFESTLVKFDYESVANVKCGFWFYPEKGHTFTESEISALQLLSSVIFSIGDRVRLMGFAHKASTSDLMTGAANQTLLRINVEEKKAKNELKNFTGIFINLKNFKYVNRALTSKNGDLVLKILVTHVMHSLKDGEVFARLGGDNFFALLKDENVDIFVDRFADYTLSEIPGLGNMRVKIRMRMGIFSMGENDTMSSMMNCSSIALDVAKNSLGKDIVHFEQSMFDRTLYQREISSVFPEALKNEEFAVFYQPKVNVQNNELYGCEALVRWFRNGKVLLPLDFVPVLEREGTICRLDFCVLERVCRNIRQWLDAGIEPVRVSTNFSKLHFKNQKLAEDILNIVARYKVPCKYLEIELTEVSDFDDNVAFARFVETIRAAGIAVSVDAFGSGYSTFNVIKNLKVDAIKLDKSLFDDLHRERDLVIVKNLVAMMKDLGMEVVAEGIESAEQFEFLKKYNCNIVQGFYYDKPLNYESFKQRLLDRQFYNKQR